MPIFTIRHITTYRYKKPVGFGEHRFLLRPRDDVHQRVIDADFAITPEPAHVLWAQDAFGNHVATARFAKRASQLRFESTIRVDHAAAAFRAKDIEDYALAFPFAYRPDDRLALERCLERFPPDPLLDGWAAGFLRDGGLRGTRDLLADMTRTIHHTFKHVARHEKGIQDPVRTLRLGSGSCRDLAVLMIAGLRALGIAARFVSGYLHLPDDDAGDDPRGGNTHAWVQAYVPGPGWVDFDPSGGTVGNRGLVRVAVAHEPSEVIPLQGTWYGSAADHLDMIVAVKVTSVDRDASRWSRRRIAS